jgi:nitrite reductase/ring-hydroxylating ferredoxin subunit
MGQWVRVASRQACPPGTARECVAADRIVALFNVDDQFYALDGICPHQGGPLGKGRLQGEIVTCPWHGWQFNVRTGQHQVNASLCHPRLETKVEGDDVFVFLDDAGNPPGSS